MSNSSIVKNNNKGDEKEILEELKKEICHHDIFSFKLEDKSLNDILSSIKPFDKKFFHYQRYNFNLEGFNKDLCSFYDIVIDEKINNNNNNDFIKANKNEIKEQNLIDEDGKRKKISDILSDKNLKISEVLEKIMEDVNIFDKIYQEEKDKLENEEIKIDIEGETTKSELKYKYFQQTKEKEKEIKKKMDKIITEKLVSPIEMVDKIEKDYNDALIKKIKNETKNTDLYPLDTYKKNHELKVQLLVEQEKISQFKNLKEVLIKESTNSNSNTNEEKDNFNVFVIDKPSQEPGSINPRYIYVGTDLGKVIKILLNNRGDNQELSAEEFDSKENGINTIDIYENYMVTGHQNGSIVFWEDNKIFDKIQNINQNEANEIIYLKIIKMISIPKKKFEIIFSDKNGNVYFLRRTVGFFGYTGNKELLISDNGNPTYKISFYSHQNETKKIKKKMMIFALTSTKGITLLTIRSKIQNKSIIFTIGPPKGRPDNGIFDSSFGLGFPPLEDKSKGNNIRGSISDSIVIGKGENENLFLSVSYGEIINLYNVIITEINPKKLLYKYGIVPIAHFVNDKKIISISFLTNSYIAIITNDFYLKVINTFDFDKKEFKEEHGLTKNSLLIYEPIELKKLIMKKQTNIFKYNEKDGNYSNYYIYLNTIVPLNKSIIILGMNNLYQYTLSQWDAIIQSLDRAKQYEKMLWLSMVVFNNNKNLLTIKSQNRNEEFLINYKYQICSPIISKFLIQVVMMEIEKNNNFIPIRMLIEFCINSDLYDCLYETIIPLTQKGYDKYLYQNLTKNILNDDCRHIEFKPSFLIYYIKYYVENNKKDILSEALFHINIFTLINEKLVLSALEEFKIINPLIYSQIKNIKQGEIDYFSPIKYLYKFFHNDYLKEKENKLFDDETNKGIKDEYYKLITENEIKYYNESISTYYEFLGHKILWYCNKCLSGEEFHTENKMTNNNFNKVAKKIIIFLTSEEIMKDFLEFDSFSYFQLISRYFTEDILFNLIHREVESFQDLFVDLDDFIKTYLGNIKSVILTDKFFFYVKIQDFINNTDNIYIKYDYYEMISKIVEKNDIKFHLDKDSIKNAIIFFINYYHNLKKASFPNKFNCHKKFDNLNEFKEQIENFENKILTMIKSLEAHSELIKEDIDELLNLNNISPFKKIHKYLYEISHQYEECFKLYMDDLEEGNKTLEEVKIFFGWINVVLSLTLELEKSGILKEKIHHEKFKDFILLNINYLSNLSIKELAILVDKWFKGEEEKIISKLNDSKSRALQFKYINYYLSTHEYDREKGDENDTYYKFLLLKINLLIKVDHKEQIINVLHHNSFLCKNESLLNNLLSLKVYDSCIYIFHILNKLDKGIDLANKEIKKTLQEINEEIHSKKYLSTNIDILLNKFQKYIELGLGICQKSSNLQKKEKELVNDYWLPLISIVYTFQVNFTPELKENRNNYKTADYLKINNALIETFESIIKKMTDFISLPLIMDILEKKCEKARFTKFKGLNFLMFSNFRLDEIILNLSKNLSDTRLNLEINNYLYERNKGHITSLKYCSSCFKFFGINKFNEIKYFNCNHIFHRKCFIKEGEGDECPICKRNECVFNYNENNYFDEIDKIKIGKEVMEEMRKEEEKINKNKMKREKIIKLKRLRIKRNEINQTFINSDTFSD